MIRVLVVEDDPLIARGYERLIRRRFSPCDIVVVNSAEIAVVMLFTQDFDLVISDFDLAGKRTGADVLEAVRADLNRPAFLFVSGNEVVETLGAPFLDKPCAPSALRDAIGAAIARRAA